MLLILKMTLVKKKLQEFYKIHQTKILKSFNGFRQSVAVHCFTFHSNWKKLFWTAALAIS